jgi:hypothetical protein
LSAAEINPVLAQPRACFVQQRHKLLRRCEHRLVRARAGIGERLRQRRLPGFRVTGMLGESNLGALVAAKPVGNQALQPAVSGLDGVTRAVRHALPGAGCQRGEHKRNGIHRHPPAGSLWRKSPGQVKSLSKSALPGMSMPGIMLGMMLSMVMS